MSKDKAFAVYRDKPDSCFLAVELPKQWTVDDVDQAIVKCLYKDAKKFSRKIRSEIGTRDWILVNAHNKDDAKAHVRALQKAEKVQDPGNIPADEMRYLRSRALAGDFMAAVRPGDNENLSAAFKRTEQEQFGTGETAERLMSLSLVEYHLVPGFIRNSEPLTTIRSAVRKKFLAPQTP